MRKICCVFEEFIDNQKHSKVVIDVNVIPNGNNFLEIFRSVRRHWKVSRESKCLPQFFCRMSKSFETEQYKSDYWRKSCFAESQLTFCLPHLYSFRCDFMLCLFKKDSFSCFWGVFKRKSIFHAQSPQMSTLRDN